MLAKVERKSDLIKLENFLEYYQKLYGIVLPVIVPIETLEGYMNREDFFSWKYNSLLVFGYEDTSTELGFDRPKIYEPNPLNAALMQTIITSKKYDVPMIAAVSRVLDENFTELIREIEYEKSIGLIGKFSIHPNQVPLINLVYNRKRDVVKAKALLTKFDFNIQKDGSTAIKNNSNQMEDTPSIKRAKKLIELFDN